MELSTIKDAFDRVAKKQKLSSSKSQEIVTQIGQEIEQAIANMQNNNTPLTNHKLILSELKAKLKEISPLNHLEGAPKELNVALSKYPKILEKFFNPDISKAYRNVDFDIHTLNQIIASHFYREGMFDIGDCFVNESREVPEASASKSPFLEMYQILEAMRSRNLQPALTWATINHEKLKLCGADIEMKLHRQNFVEIVQNRGRDEALKYARTFFPPFSTKHLAEIQKLMGCLVYAGRLGSSPYSDLLSPNHWEKLAEDLTRQFCNLIGHSYESPLRVTVSAGVQGLPTLLKLMNVMTAKQEWQSMKELPVHVDLDREFQFHSFFVCPVSRDQATEENPPMLLSCGHVLCKQSIAKLSKNNVSRPFKCPYCPTEVEVAQCRQLYF
ncbi:unnamed protein product [Cuscuta epithymum]|uniref:Uncharacterized protein n=1 Tax=Cuscuta epithymum TaxID=186058 RepID=A0AAV0CYR0_9ASTE|nr:unnamed protein product [Cuscuta epithymum]